jgi:UDP-glucose 4-epimerase
VFVSKNSILVIGGAGYIGSHMVRLLLDNKYTPVVFDNLATGHKRFIPKGVRFIKGDLRKPKDIERVFKFAKFQAVIHFSAASLVPESMSDPLKYYDNNVLSFVYLLQTMRRHKVKNIVFSSTAATYGEPKRVPIEEDDPKDPTNTYGRSKLMMERIVEDAARAYGDINYIILRYFNVAGAHHSGQVGECHHPETHLVPNILKAVKGEKKNLTIFGDDYPTKDGSCVRDYIHVEDVCAAHLLAIRAFAKGIKNEYFNLGTETGYSNFQVIAAVERATGEKVKYTLGPRRPGDPATLVASARKAKKVLGWTPQYGLDDIVRTAWAWEKTL